MPAAVDPEAPKANRPALCVVGENVPEAQFSCEATANYMRRLCACVEGAAAGVEGGTQSRAIPVGDATSSNSVFEETADRAEYHNGDDEVAGEDAPAADDAGADGSTSSSQEKEENRA